MGIGCFGGFCGLEGLGCVGDTNIFPIGKISLSRVQIKEELPDREDLSPQQVRTSMFFPIGKNAT